MKEKVVDYNINTWLCVCVCACLPSFTISGVVDLVARGQTPVSVLPRHVLVSVSLFL